MEDKKTVISFGDKPPVTGPKPVEHSSPRECCRREGFFAAFSTPPEVNYRQTQEGEPSNGDPNSFDNNFSMTDPSGIRFDFRDGPRLMIPKDMEGTFRVVFEDSDTRYKAVDTFLKAGGSVSSWKKWYVPWNITVTKDGETVMEHALDLKDREVAIHYPKAGVGDTIAWFSYAQPFLYRTGCRLTCCMEERFRKLFESEYPDIKFENEDAWANTPYYAVYHMGIFSPDNEHDRLPEDFRLNGLHEAAGLILGIDDINPLFPPKVASIEPTLAVPADPYVCISVSASSRHKEWLNPYGWPVVVDWLKSNGYNVVGIDRDFVHGNSGLPNGVIDGTGDIDLRERAAVLKGAKAFIGVSSGLSWLAWACGIPVVLISGWTLPRTEFPTPYRVINRLVCNGCWNDGREYYDHFDHDYCPRHKGTPREHECSKAISAYQVIAKLAEALGMDSCGL